MGYESAILSAGLTTVSRGGYLLVIAVVMAVIVLFFWNFENHQVIVEKTVLIALLSAVSAAGRALFAAVPSVQPSSFIIIMTALVFGAEAGFMTGALTALLSGLLLGLGPWTVWQMLAWGLMGWLAGLFSKPLAAHHWLRVAYGVLWGFLFGWIMNVWMLMTFDSLETGLLYILGVYAASFIFDFMHAAANGLLIAFGGNAFLKMLSRIAVKYGLSGK